MKTQDHDSLCSGKAGTVLWFVPLTAATVLECLTSWASCLSLLTLNFLRLIISASFVFVRNTQACSAAKLKAAFICSQDTEWFLQRVATLSKIGFAAEACPTSIPSTPWVLHTSLPGQLRVKTPDVTWHACMALLPAKSV